MGQLKTFSIGFSEKSFDETSYGLLVRAQFKTDHKLETLSVARARQLVDECLTRLDEPMADSSLLPTYLVSGLARQDVTVALAGDGGDELFAGYDPFHALQRARLYSRIFPRPIHAAIKAIFDRLPASHANMALDFKIKRALRGLSHDRRLWLPVWMAPLDHAGLQDLFGEPIDLEEVYSEAIEQWENCPQTDLVDKTMQFYTKLYLQDDILVKADRASMMHSLEARAPFLDIELVDFVRRIPSAYKFCKGTTKYILKKALEAVLPREILYRAKKGFGVPVAHWFRKGELDLAEAPLASLNPRLVKRRAEAHRSGRTDESAFLWSFYVLKKWAETNQVSL